MAHHYSPRWASARKSHLPNLNKKCLNWFMENAPNDGNAKAMRRTAHDLLPNRVGALGGDLRQCVPVSWAMLSHMLKKETREKIPEEEHFLVLAVSFLVKTSDHKLVLSLRSDKVTQYQNCYHVTAAGYFDADIAVKNGLGNGAIEVAFKELKEEINLDKELINNFTCLGFFRITESDSANIEIAFSGTTHLSGEEVLALAREAEDRWEGNQRLFDVGDAAELLLKTPVFVPSAAGAIAEYLGLF